MKRVVTQPATKFCLVVGAVVDGDVVEGYQSWLYVHRVGTMIGDISVAYLQAQVFGIDVTSKINGLEVSKEYCLARH